MGLCGRGLRVGRRDGPRGGVTDAGRPRVCSGQNLPPSELLWKKGGAHFVFRASVTWEFGAGHVGVHSLRTDLRRPPGFRGCPGRLRALLHMSAGGRAGTWGGSSQVTGRLHVLLAQVVPSSSRSGNSRGPPAALGGSSHLPVPPLAAASLQLRPRGFASLGVWRDLALASPFALPDG